jgi:hypothetical protein
MRKVCSKLATGAMLLSFALPVVAQHDRHDNYYNGMRSQVRRGDYDRYSRDDHRHDSGGIGPGKGALIGGAGGAVLGAIFGGGLKGTIIGGAAGAGIGAIGGKIAQDNRDDHHYRRHY